MFTEQQNKELMAPLHVSVVKVREQGGRKLSYIEGWQAISEANRIFGFGMWSRETVEVRQIVETTREIGSNKTPGWQVGYTARVRVTVMAEQGAAIVREGYGTGHGIDKDLGLAHESAIKEAETDAMKRALMTFGNPFGLALYDKDQVNVVDTLVDSAKLMDFENAVKDAISVREIEAIFKDHRDNLTELGKTDEAEYTRLAKLYQTRKAELKAAEAKDGSK